MSSREWWFTGVVQGFALGGIVTAVGHAWGWWL